MTFHVFILCIFLACANFNVKADSALSLNNQELLRAELYQKVFSSHNPITYKDANIILFTQLDNKEGIFCSVYSPEECLQTDIVPSPKLMNIEHTWPQSEGANGFAKSDLHHLFATSSKTNSIRSSLPFCEVSNVLWTNGFSRRGFNESNEHCFEPPKNHRGNVARAIFYFSIRYNFPIDPNQESILRKWHIDDPVNDNELRRNLSILSIQKNSNPFIERPELVEKILDF
jgi:hypothetical protein